jgi:dTDP-4-amino-4,6-dideoxygalactose transaminase
VIAFSRPASFDVEMEYLSQVRDSGSPWGGGAFYQRAAEKLKSIHKVRDVLLTQSCTSALELAALGLDVGPGDEVIVPSYTFVTSASAFALRGVKVVFVDSEPETLNIDVSKVEELITSKTKAIVAVHYGGVACDMDALMAIASRHGVVVVEDAAQAIGSTYKGRPLGSIGDLGCISFHGTKNVSSGEGGALFVNTQDPAVIDRVHTAHEKGTDRAKFLRGEVDKYTWRGLGSSFIPSEFTSALLLAQLENLPKIHSRREAYWRTYRSELEGLRQKGFKFLKQDQSGSNFHMFAIMAPSSNSRESLRSHLREQGIVATSHYEPLDASPFALENFPPIDAAIISRDSSTRILRLPLWSELGLDVDYISRILLAGAEKVEAEK